MCGAKETVARSPMQFSKPAVVVACPSRPLSSSVMRPSSSRTRILKPLIVICRSHIAVEVCMLDCEVDLW